MCNSLVQSIDPEHVHMKRLVVAALQLTATSVTIKMLTFFVVNFAALIFLAAGSREL